MFYPIVVDDNLDVTSTDECRIRAIHSIGSLKRFKKYLDICIEINIINTGVYYLSFLIKMEDASFPGGGVNPASSKSDTGRGNGPLPLGGSGLMEEMSALLARR